MARPKPANSISKSPLESIDKTELLCVIALVGVGLLLRGWNLSQVAVEHFDEGVYASNIWFDADQGYRYPDRHLYAPSLLPALLEFSIALFGTGAVGTIGVGIAAGTLTLVSLWWVVRSWFGTGAGLAALALAAGSDYHILYSRTALTDPLLGLWMVWAAYWGERALRQGGVGRVLLAGLFTALAWWTKYNGWLPLAILASGGLAYAARQSWRTSWQPLKLFALRWSGIAIVAVVGWCPYYFSLKSTGGYASVSANHAQYVEGFNGWFDRLLQQLANCRYWDSWLSVAAVAVAVALIAVACARSGFTWNGRRVGSTAIAAVACGAASAWIGSWLFLHVLFIAVIGLGLGRHLRGTTDAEQSTKRASICWLLAAWWCGLCLATPLYRPFPRLLLPWLLVTWIGAAYALQVGWQWWQEQRKPTPKENETPDAQRSTFRSKTAQAAAICGLLLAVSLVGRIAPLTAKGIPAWQPRTGLSEIAAETIHAILADAGPSAASDRVVIYVYAEPALLYHLNARGIVYCGPVSNMGFLVPRPNRPPYPTYLVTGPHAEQTAGFDEQLEAARSQLKLVGELQYRPSDLVWLNQVSPQTLRSKASPLATVRIYRAAM